MGQSGRDREEGSSAQKPQIAVPCSWGSPLHFCVFASAMAARVHPQRFSCLDNAAVVLVDQQWVLRDVLTGPVIVHDAGCYRINRELRNAANSRGLYVKIKGAREPVRPLELRAKQQGTAQALPSGTAALQGLIQDDLALLGVVSPRFVPVIKSGNPVARYRPAAEGKQPTTPAHNLDSLRAGPGGPPRLWHA